MIDLQFKDVSKRYLVRQEVEPYQTAHPLMRKWQSLRLRKREFWAVLNVSFEVERGEAVGIIGKNGAGKSTILKLLSNITTPTSGEITINGRLSALIEVGSGFHPELTGRENIFLSGSILGMRRGEIAAKLDQIVDFAEIRPFIDTPVKRYSSGMYVRLGFSIAAHLDPDILLLDEVLAVGDAAFQSKCLQRIGDLKRGGKTIVFVSHDLGSVERLCDRVILLQQGQIHAVGTPREIVATYLELSSGNHSTTQAPRAHGAILSKQADITSVTLSDAAGVQTVTGKTGYPLTVKLAYRAHERIKDAAFELFFYSQDNELRCHLTSELDGGELDLAPGAGAVEFFCPKLGLNPGIYHLGATIVPRGAPIGTAIDWRDRCALLRVDPGKTTRGEFYMPSQWKVTQGATPAEAVKLT